MLTIKHVELNCDPTIQNNILISEEHFESLIEPYKVVIRLDKSFMERLFARSVVGHLCGWF